MTLLIAKKLIEKNYLIKFEPQLQLRKENTTKSAIRYTFTQIKSSLIIKFYFGVKLVGYNMTKYP